MHDLLFGTWAAQLIVAIKQYPLQVTIMVLTVCTFAMTLMLGVRGSGSGDSGGISFGDSDGDGGGCGGD